MFCGIEQEESLRTNSVRLTSQIKILMLERLKRLIHSCSVITFPEDRSM